jgi:DNA primase
MNLFSFIKERISILDVVTQYVTLKKAGGYHKGTCPFHHEKTASFTVSPEKHIFYCFGCHLSGDVISFIAKIEHCSQKDAALFLIEKYSLQLPSTISFETAEKATQDKNHYFGTCKAVALWCHEQLLKNHLAQSYFHQRGFNTENLIYFTVGYFPGGTVAINNLLYAMKQQSILAQDLIDAQILVAGRTNLYSPFEDRLLFPIRDTLGRYCGFGGRIFKEQDTRPKYYNSRENDYFVKGSLLFNLDKAKKNIQETGILFLVEGYTDCMAMIQNGIPNTVATLGTACTLEHLKQLARYADHVMVVYDNDSAGNTAILRLTELCWQVNLELKIIMLPQGEDPASFLTQNKGDFQSFIAQAEDIFHFFLTTVGHNFLTKSLSQKMNIIRSFLAIIAPIADPLKKDILLHKAAKIFDMPLESLKQELNRTKQKEELVQLMEPSATPTCSAIPLLEKRIFCAIMNNIELLNEDGFPFIGYLPSPLREILIQLNQTKEKTKNITFGCFFDKLNEEDKHYVSKILLEEDEAIDSSAFNKLVQQLQKKQWKNIVQAIKTQIMQAKQESDQEKADLILQNFMRLQNSLFSTPDHS